MGALRRLQPLGATVAQAFDSCTTVGSIDDNTLGVYYLHVEANVYF